MNEVVVVLAFTVAGFAAGWFARGGAPAAPPEATSDAQQALDQLAAACDSVRESPTAAARSRLHTALAAADRTDVEMESTLGADDPTYRRFEEELNALLSTAHRLDAQQI